MFDIDLADAADEPWKLHGDIRRHAVTGEVTMVLAASLGSGFTGERLVIVLLGAALLTFTAWQWAGRTPRARRWVHRLWGREATLGVQPGAGMMLFFIGLGSILGDAAPPVLVLPGILGMVIAFAGMLFVIPKWWGPGWYRRMPAEERDRPDVTDPLTAGAVVLTEEPRVSSAREARQMFDRKKALQSWRGGWVYDPDTDERAHGLSRKGTIDGIVMLYDAGLLFAASRREDAIRAKATVLVIKREDIISVRVVPARAGADGVPRRGIFYRSWFPRLVVATADRNYVFDINLGRAQQAFEKITAATEVAQ